jgi:hypothetical protein
MDAFADLVATRKVRRFRIPPAALPARKRAARQADTALTLRIIAGLAMLTLFSLVVLIAEPWETLRPWLLQP